MSSGKKGEMVRAELEGGRTNGAVVGSKVPL